MTTIIGIGCAGILLLFLEMFLPGMIAGIAGAILLVTAVVMAYTDLGTEAGNIALVLAVVVSAVMWWWWAKYFQRTRLGRMMTLESSSTGDTTTPGLQEFVGMAGTALTSLRPGGTVLIGGRHVDAMTDGEFIERDTAIVVVRRQGSTVVVRGAAA